MQINENDIASTEPFGVLDGKQVMLTKTKGGLNLAVLGDNVLGAASHQAILCYSIEQRYPNFQPMIMKSEGLKLNADSHSHFLSDDLRKSGHDIYSVQNGNEVEFFVTKQNIKVNSTKGTMAGEILFIKSEDLPTIFDKDLLTAVSSAVSEKALSSGLKSVKVQ